MTEKDFVGEEKAAAHFDLQNVEGKEGCYYKMAEVDKYFAADKLELGIAVEPFFVELVGENSLLEKERSEQQWLLIVKVVVEKDNYVGLMAEEADVSEPYERGIAVEVDYIVGFCLVGEEEIVESYWSLVSIVEGILVVEFDFHF